MHFTERIIGEAPEYLLLQPTARHEAPFLEQEIEALAAGIPVSFVLVLVHLDDWTVDLMPWPDRHISRDERAGKCAGQTLAYILSEVLPHYPDLPVIIGGYSLAGLFSLWASMQTDRFTGVAAASPSLWITGWIPYAEQHPPRAESIYLSLGDREEIAKNKAIARVGDCVRAQYELLCRQYAPEHCTLVWEPGNHFTDNPARLARAFSWCVRLGLSK